MEPLCTVPHKEIDMRVWKWIKWFSKKIHWWQEAGYFMSNRCVVNNIQKRLNIAKWVSEKLFQRKFNVELHFVEKCHVVISSRIKTKFGVHFFPRNTASEINSTKGGFCVKYNTYWTLLQKFIWETISHQEKPMQPNWNPLTKSRISSFLWHWW